MELKKEWNANEWEEYLKTIESPQTELLLDDPELVEAISEEKFKEGVANNMGQNYSAQLNKIIGLLMEGLTEKQKQVLHHLFWESRTQRETARIMGIRHSSVQKIRERALTSFGRILLKSRKDLSQKDEEIAA